MNQSVKTNPLGEESINTLLKRFAIPSIIAMLVGALYNIVDQFFIGRSVGELGNAATNISFPLTTSCIAIALLFGIGGASAFNLAMGQGKRKEAVYYVGNAAVLLFGGGLILTVVTQLFLTPMLKLFGSPDNILDYARVYTRITSIGFPFLIIATGGGHLIRADGSPRFTMVCNLTGAIINTILDALFVFGLEMGMAGAALATIIGQFISGSMAIYYLCHYKTASLTKQHLKLKLACAGKIISLGAAPCSNQLAMMLVQIILNKSLTYYGNLSAYGSSIPLACAGIITKINQVFLSFVIGISQGLQPIVSFNYGAKKYQRVKKAYLKACGYGAAISIFAFLMFQIFPQNIITLFGNGSEEYYQFAIRYFKVFLFFTFWNFCQPITSNFFTAIGKPGKGIFLSLTRQIIFLLPLIIVLPLIIGIDGILYAGPIADCLAGITSFAMIFWELRKQQYA